MSSRLPSFARHAPGVISLGILFSLAVPAQLRFDAAEIHRSVSATNPQSYRSGGFLRGERYELRKATMLDLIRLAYGFEPDDIVGGPDWLAFTRFDIAAKARASTAPEDLRVMLRALLAERFALVLHKDVRPVPAFALKLGKDRPKIRKAEGPGDAGCRYLRQPDASEYTVYACRGMTMAGLAQQLRSMAGDYLADRVVDETGLTGEWDFELRWNSRGRILSGGAERTTIFKAIDQQLGLKLTAEKVPEDVIVVDSVNENPGGYGGALLPPRELRFEVASVKLSGPDVHDGYSGARPGRFEAVGETMRNLFATAWDIHWDHVDEMVAGMPKWMDSARYDIVAKPAAVSNGPPPPLSSFVDDDMRLMLRALLTERFHIKAHYENRPVKAYTLVAVKPRLKKADAANRAHCGEAHTVENDPRDLNPRLSRLLACQNVTMAQFAEQLMPVSANDFAYAVVDATGVSGRWDFMLSYSPTGDPRNPADGGDPSDPNGRMSIFDAVKKQLGLRLELRKRMLPVLVIDHIEEQPVQN